MTYYLIDYENRKEFGDLSLLEAEDTILFFYSDKANSMSFELHQNIIKSPADKMYFYAETGGKNALDFQLSTYLGYLIGVHPEEDFYIISGDKGFDAVVRFWKQHNPSVRLMRRERITPPPAKTLNATAPKATSVEEGVTAPSNLETVVETEISPEVTALGEKLRNATLKLSEDQITIILDIFTKYKTKSAINNNLQKHFSNEEVSKINKVMKPFLKEKS